MRLRVVLDGNTQCVKKSQDVFIVALLILLPRASLRERFVLAFFLGETVSSTNRFCGTQSLHFRCKRNGIPRLFRAHQASFLGRDSFATRCFGITALR
jgi:hypothetical protein